MTKFKKIENNVIEMRFSPLLKEFNINNCILRISYLLKRSSLEEVKGKFIEAFEESKKILVKFTFMSRIIHRG
jgi:hypothetical protein